MVQEELGPGRKKKLYVLVGVIAIVCIAAAAILLFVGKPTPDNTGGGITARFDFSPTAPRAGANISFTDRSTGNPATWSWDFGDGARSTSRNPTHRYASVGTYTVTLTITYADGSTKTSTRQVTVSPETPTGTYIVYSDAGIAPDEVPPVDVWVWSGADFGLPEPVIVEGKYVVPDAPEGTEVFICTSGSGGANYVGWGVFLGADAAAGHQWIAANSVDVTGYSKLEFWVKTPVNLKVELEELPTATPETNPTAKGRKTRALRIGTYGWNSEDPGWQKISIPISAFIGADMTKLRCPFMITGEGGDKTFYVDEVVWVP